MAPRRLRAAMIALTARDLGATVVTNDASDYAAIQQFVDVSIMVV